MPIMETPWVLSIMGFEERKQIFRPLIPDVDFTFNNEAD
jgi:hypothetical protein